MQLRVIDGCTLTSRLPPASSKACVPFLGVLEGVWKKDSSGSHPRLELLDQEVGLLWSVLSPTFIH